MTTDLDTARICLSSYEPTFKWDKLWSGSSSDDIYVGMVSNVICFRGSVSLEDWFRDIEADAINDPVLGGLHDGFAKGVFDFFIQNKDCFNNDTIVCGHSLGAARALIFGGYMEQDGIRPKAIIVFGSPRPGFARLKEILQSVTVRSYKNRFDPVTDVPVPFPDLPYVHPRDSLPIDIRPPATDIGLLADHHPFGYVEGCPATEIT